MVIGSAIGRYSDRFRWFHTHWNYLLEEVSERSIAFTRGQSKTTITIKTKLYSICCLVLEQQSLFVFFATFLSSADLFCRRRVMQKVKNEIVSWIVYYTMSKLYWRCDIWNFFCIYIVSIIWLFPCEFHYCVVIWLKKQHYAYKHSLVRGLVRKTM